MMKLLRMKWKAIESTIGPFVPSGKTIMTLNEITESVTWKINARGDNVEIKIPHESGKAIYLNDEFVNKDNDVKQMIFNCIINQAFRETTLKQIGRSPRFFDISAPIDLSRQNLLIMPGFKASAFQTSMGCTLALDSIFKFMCTTTCLEKIKEMKDRSHSDHQFEQMVKLEFTRKSVIGNWGNKRTYIVHDVDFEKSVSSVKFTYNNVEVTIADYFK